MSPSDAVSAHALGCLLRVGGVRSYAGFFTAERFYALGVRVEAMKEDSVVESLIVRISELIRDYQLPLKYLCYIVGDEERVDCRWCAGCGTQQVCRRR